MSAYLQFFIKTDNATVEFMSFCRSNVEYQIFKDIGVEYGSVTELTNELCAAAIANAEDLQHCNDKDMADLLDKRSFLRTCTMPTVGDLMVEYNSTTDQLDDCNQYNDEIQHALNFLGFLREMKSELSYSLTPGRIYVGIEVGLEDFEKEID